MSKVQLECQVFKERMQKIIEAMGSEVDGVMIAIGKREEVKPYGINSAMFLYLLGYEFPETVLIIRKTELVTIASAKKSLILEQLSAQVTVRSLIKEKNGSNQEDLDREVAALAGDKPIGVLAEERGPLVERWMSAQKTQDVTDRIEKIFLTKDAQQKELLITAGECAKYISDLLERKLRACIKLQSNVTQEEVAEELEKDLETELEDLPKGVDQTYLEMCFSPVIQSGGRYRTEKTAEGEFFNPYKDQVLCYDVISYYIWIAYKGYCSLAGRVMLVDPNEKSEYVLGTTIEVMEHLLSAITTDKTFEEIQKSCAEHLQQRVREEYQAELVKALQVKIGESIGVRPVEGGQVSQQAHPQNSMVFAVSVGFGSVKNLVPDALADVHIDNIVRMENNHAVLLTPFSTSVKDYVAYKPEEEGARAQTGRRYRNKQKEFERIREINEHQKHLMDELIEEQLRYYKEQDPLCLEKEEAVPTKQVVAYQKETQMARGLPAIKVDKRSSTVILPIFGMAVPFYISTIKNVTKTIEDKIGYLKVAFHAPPAEEQSEHNLLSLVVKDKQELITTAWKDITALKKEEEKVEEDGPEEGEQEELQRVYDKVETLQNVYLRFDHRIGAKKSAVGTLELHRNGLRYHTKQKGHVDLLFSKVKHMFYQPGVAEHPTIIHFKLHTPIIVQEKKTTDVQFFRNCLINVVHDTRKSQNRMCDEEEEIYEEEEEIRMREEVNDAFLEFAELVARQSRLTLEEPLSKGFHGVPHRQNVLIQPTEECLVNLTEFPFFVLPFKEIELLNFERRIIGVNTCDMVFVLKDKAKMPVSIFGVHFSDVPWLMDFLDSKNICFTETKINIQWPNVLKSIMADPVAFYEGGAWAILQANRESDNEDNQEESEAANLDTTEESSTDEEFSTNDGTVSEEDEEDEEEEDYTETEEEEEESEIYRKTEEGSKKKKTKH
ncbi:hypothetical protein NECID01_0063 [Nematocida sp. AWRm77]|nr:hypothetical protein NECID01_0063 [Nematocida sp. AWRm77]